jgi:hypothetical protein
MSGHARPRWAWLSLHWADQWLRGSGQVRGPGSLVDRAEDAVFASLLAYPVWWREDRFSRMR